MSAPRPLALLTGTGIQALAMSVPLYQPSPRLGVPTHAGAPQPATASCAASQEGWHIQCAAAVPAVCPLGTGALTALLVADVLMYLVDSPGPAHTVET